MDEMQPLQTNGHELANQTSSGEPESQAIAGEPENVANRAEESADGAAQSGIDRLAEPAAAADDYARAAGDSAPVVVDSWDREEESSVLPYPVVGIGASAGGLEAFIDLLRTTPADTGMSFVILSHLAPKHRSLLPEILGRSANMPVIEIRDGMKPEPDKVFVMPANAQVALGGGVFRLEGRPRPDPLPRPIDVFFRSLAHDQKTRAIGVVLSGTDADGALGLRAIKGEGGISIVQDERTAKFDTMPRSAIAADHVDLVLPPEEIGAELGRISRELKQFGHRAPPPAEVDGDDRRALARIYGLLRNATGVDFSLYKQSTLRRRILRRMVIRKIGSFGEYARFLKATFPEVRELYEDALIGVTRFFRDPEVFDALKSQIFPFLFQNRQADEPIRIWAPGCASGEEVYSIAICLLEFLGNLGVQAPIQIFGTDVSEKSIEKARSGAYPETAAADVSAERIRRFFIKSDKGYQVAKRLREVCVFARHDLTRDPPFAHLDLVSCRNVLIYFEAPAQRQIIAGFHYALNYPGALVLGQSESIREYYNLFTRIDKQNKFYNCASGTSRFDVDLLARGPFPDLRRAARDLKEPGPENLTDLQRAIDRIVVARHGPPGVVVNEQMDVVQTRGDTSAFLMLPPGGATLNILRMAKEGLGHVLRDALQRAIHDDVPVAVEGVRIGTGSKGVEMALEVLPIPNLPARRFLALFVTKDTRADEPALAPLGTSLTLDEKDREIGKLRQDLASTKLYLQSLIEERDAKNQELISANEEIQSSNEELQSINEELETAKEELQSSNEELQTVNEELSRKNEQLGQTTSDLTNLLNNITMPVLILSADLHIRQFTPLAERLLSMRPADLGRHIGEIRLNLRIDDLEPLLSEVIETLASKEWTVQDRQGAWYLLRAKPYRTVDNKIDGVMVVLVDINQIHSMQEELQQARDFARMVVESVKVPLAVLDSNLAIQMANRAFLETASLNTDRVLNRSFPELAAETWNMEKVRPMLAQLRENEGFAFEHTYNRDRTLLVNVQSISPGGGPGILIALENISARKQAEHFLRLDKERLEGKVQLTEEALGRSHEELQKLTASLLIAQEEERRRIARDLHDDLTQKLGLLEMQVEKLEQGSEERSIRQGLAEIHRQASELSEGLRRVAHELHPQILEDLGLAVALERLVEEFKSRRDMPVQFSARSVPDRIPSSVASSFYRIVQEALHNITKHAGEPSVRVTLAGEGNKLELTVQDDGVGFNVGEARFRGGLGLVGMQERVRLMGGTFSVTSQPDQGTRIEVAVPLPGADLGEDSHGADAPA